MIATDTKAPMKAPMKARGAAGGWPVDDITGLGRRLPEIDPARYFDEQARESYRHALVKWPVLARLMKLVPADDVASPAAQSPARAPVLE